MSAPDLLTTYLGLELASPLVPSSSPLTGDVATLRRLEAAGAGAVVLPSLFQEQLEHEEVELGRLHQFGAESFPEAAGTSGYFPWLESYNTGPEGYLRLVEEARSALSIPVIASLNGVSRDGWQRHARRVEEAGAHAVELNLHHVPTDPATSGKDVEDLFVDQVAAVRDAVAIPIAVKLGPHLSAPANLAKRLAAAGANGVVLFNRPLEPTVDLESMEIVPRLELSRPSEARLPLRWIAILSAHTTISLASTSGIHSAEDAVRAILVGADVAMVTSTLLKHGPDSLRELVQGVWTWMLEHEYASVAQMKGSMNHAHCPDPGAFERIGYMRALTSFTGPWS